LLSRVCGSGVGREADYPIQENLFLLNFRRSELSLKRIRITMQEAKMLTEV
jgi:hypothetical protein